MVWILKYPFQWNIGVLRHWNFRLHHCFAFIIFLSGHSMLFHSFPSHIHSSGSYYSRKKSRLISRIKSNKPRNEIHFARSTGEPLRSRSALNEFSIGPFDLSPSRSLRYSFFFHWPEKNEGEKKRENREIIRGVVREDSIGRRGRRAHAIKAVEKVQSR